MQTVTIFGPNLRGAYSGTFHVHAEGCADTRKALYRGIDPPWSIDATSQEDIVTDIFSDIMAENDGQYAEWEAYESEVRFFPCVKLPRENAETAQ